MLRNLLRRTFGFKIIDAHELLESELLDESTFYPTLIKDLKKCHSELIIKSPFITNRRLELLLPTLQKLKEHKVRIVINTRDPQSSDDEYQREDARRAISKLQHIGVHVLYTAGHHRKIVIIDRKVLYEGSLNVLSQNNSSEIMRRIDSVPLAWQMVEFIDIDKYI